MKFRLGLVSVLLLLLAACGGSSSNKAAKPAATVATTTTTAAPTTTTTSLASLGDRYLVIVKGSNDAGCVFGSAFQKLANRHAPFSDTQGIATAFANSLQTFTTQLTQIDWSATIKPDAVVVEQTTAAMIGDIESLPSQTAASYSQWQSQYGADSNKSSLAASNLRHDIGLPPAAPLGC